jgi:hypothetical protein
LQALRKTVDFTELVAPCVKDFTVTRFKGL